MTAEAALAGGPGGRWLNKGAFAIANSTDIGVVAADDRIPIYDTSGALMGFTTPAAVQTVLPVSLTGTGAITAAAHANRPLLMGASGAALTFTLPAATGSGNTYMFIVSVVNTSNYLIKASAGSMVFTGQIIGQSSGDSATDAPRTWIPGATDDTITLNGTTTGGKGKGDWIEFIDLSTTQWFVTGMVQQSGSEATMFSDTVT